MSTAGLITQQVAVSNTIPMRNPDWSGTVGPPFGAGLITLGITIIVIFLGLTAGWSLLAPLESAVVAPGVIVVDSHVKTVQHLEGGIVESIAVREGDKVKAGDLLITLQDTMPASALNEIRAQYLEARATAARLVAERDNADSLTFPPDLISRSSEQNVHDAIAGQESIFQSRRTLLKQQLTILERTISGLQIEIQGLEGQIAASRTGLTLIGEELSDALKLLSQGLTNRPRVLALQRHKAEIEGSIASYLASIGAAQQRIEQARLRSAELQASSATEVVKNLDAVRTRAYELAQKLAAAEDVMQRTQIRSPTDGIIVTMKVHTIGGVISAGQPLMDIVPDNDKLIVQASIDALDIDQVQAGLPVTVWLWAINRRNRAALEGRLQMVSADRVVDPKSGSAYYVGRVEIDSMPSDASVALQPGMGADVMIRTGARTPWEYVKAPIARFIQGSLREE
ncbi:HlyD family type I secretion periplasmic adaptor subunit [Microvirga massiliensis]|uniref:HlyD family type I secretion periplasmic adaptor subunit n=1 Tax=Microvirga massiliensis TaxID=1033741 RepID=UPI000661365D|nr:HlyD family type I secretion periplasmic adaptor subunit [Microvirga massiliensis]